MPNTKFIALFVLIGVVGCTSKKEKLAEAIYELETSDSSSTPKGMNDLAEMYYDYAKKFTKDSIAEKYLYKGFMFKYINSQWDDALKFADFYKISYPNTEYLHSINLKLADVYDKGKNNLDSAVHYYLVARGKTQFSTDDYRKAANTLERWATANPNSTKRADALYEAARFYQTAGDYDTAVRRYAIVANTYPAYEKSPDALMAAGFICWNDLKKPVEGKLYYTQLTQKYPDHPLAKEAKIILTENIMGMTDMELSEYLMKKNKEKGEVQ